MLLKSLNMLIITDIMSGFKQKLTGWGNGMLGVGMVRATFDPQKAIAYGLREVGLEKAAAFVDWLPLDSLDAFLLFLEAIGADDMAQFLRAIYKPRDTIYNTISGKVQVLEQYR